MLVKSQLKQIHTFLSALKIYQLSYQTRKKHFFKIKDESPQKVPVVLPNQYPTNLVDAAPMIKRGRPVRFLTPRDDIP